MTDDIVNLDDERVRRSGGVWLIGPESCPCEAVEQFERWRWGEA